MLQLVAVKIFFHLHTSASSCRKFVKNSITFDGQISDLSVVFYMYLNQSHLWWSWSCLGWHHLVQNKTQMVWSCVDVNTWQKMSTRNFLAYSSLPVLRGKLKCWLWFVKRGTPFRYHIYNYIHFIIILICNDRDTEFKLQWIPLTTS